MIEKRRLSVLACSIQMQLVCTCVMGVVLKSMELKGIPGKGVHFLMLCELQGVKLWNARGAWFLSGFCKVSKSVLDGSYKGSIHNQPYCRWRLKTYLCKLSVLSIVVQAVLTPVSRPAAIAAVMFATTQNDIAIGLASSWASSSAPMSSAASEVPIQEVLVKSSTGSAEAQNNG